VFDSGSRNSFEALALVGEELMIMDDGRSVRVIILDGSPPMRLVFAVLLCVKASPISESIIKLHNLF
jgi:hypothetical protein